jgi:S1-C subfamily serine protease
VVLLSKTFSAAECFVSKGYAAKVVKDANQKPVILFCDAAIYGGNSGGALLNEKGQLIGIPTCNILTKQNRIIPNISLW